MDDRALRPTGLDLLAPTSSPAVGVLDALVGEWREREAALQHAPADLRLLLESPPSVDLPAAIHGRLEAWLPTARALRRTSWALHEYLGYWVYGLRDP